MIGIETENSVTVPLPGCGITIFTAISLSSFSKAISDPAVHGAQHPVRQEDLPL